jgi:hypothetical protein
MSPWSDPTTGAPRAWACLAKKKVEAMCDVWANRGREVVRTDDGKEVVELSWGAGKQKE